MGFAFSFGLLVGSVSSSFDFASPSKEIQWLVSVFTGIIFCVIVYRLTAILSSLFFMGYGKLSSAQRIEWNNRGFSTFHALFASFASFYLLMLSDIFNEGSQAELVVNRSSTFSNSVLGAKIREEVLTWQPISLSQAMDFACRQEEEAGKLQSKFQSHTALNQSWLPISKIPPIIGINTTSTKPTSDSIAPPTADPEIFTIKTDNFITSSEPHFGSPELVDKIYHTPSGPTPISVSTSFTHIVAHSLAIDNQISSTLLGPDLSYYFRSIILSVTRKRQAITGQPRSKRINSESLHMVPLLSLYVSSGLANDVTPRYTWPKPTATKAKAPDSLKLPWRTSKKARAKEGWDNSMLATAFNKNDSKSQKPSESISPIQAE